MSRQTSRTDLERISTSRGPAKAQILHGDEAFDYARYRVRMARALIEGLESQAARDAVSQVLDHTQQQLEDLEASFQQTSRDFERRYREDCALANEIAKTRRLVNDLTDRHKGWKRADQLLNAQQHLIALLTRQAQVKSDAMRFRENMTQMRRKAHEHQEYGLHLAEEFFHKLQPPAESSRAIAGPEPAGRRQGGLHAVDSGSQYD